MSERLRQFLTDRNVEAVEFLPVNVHDVEGRLLEERYFIVNCTRAVDCLDRAASHAEESMMTDDVDAVKGIVLMNLDALDGLELARLAGFGTPTLVTRELADAVSAQGFSGVRFGELADFKDKTW